MNETQTSETLERLRQFLRQYESALVAYSGGVDSAVVLAVAGQVLGSRVLACIGVSASYPRRERVAAVELARQLGVAIRIVETTEQEDPNYTANPANRCYYCKSRLYADLAALARQEHYAVVLDGNNASDQTDDRPGGRAGREHGVVSPLAALGITKPLVRLLARHLGLDVWDKPATPCLSSRVPHGVPIVPGLLERIEQAEDTLVALGFTEFRVRHHGELARVELPEKDLPRALELRGPIVAGIERAGYKFVTLDLTGFCSGKLHALSARGHSVRGAG